ncbi:MAG: hypothetical protein JZU70_09610 [Chlorobium sp.]|jgi:hypothetical protein|nr:hypothetical protein [Chlorobium sp.]
MTDYRYSLERGGLKYACPACGKIRFVRYVDTGTGEQVDDVVGRCDREDSCGYHLTPKEYYLMTGKNTFSSVAISARKREPVPEQEPSFIDVALMQASLIRYEQNNFCRWLCSVFGERKAFELTAAYQIGTSKHWKGATVFWQLDHSGQIRTGKIMLYSSDTGRRVKEPFNHVNWVHRVMKIEPYHLQQCFFGEHLLSMETIKPVAIVESEKTAVVASGYIPEFVWLASAGKNNLNTEKLKILQGRTVKLFPDLGAFEKWNAIVAGMSSVTVSDVLERRATEADRVAGHDLADYLLRENKPAMTAWTTPSPEL